MDEGSLESGKRALSEQRGRFVHGFLLPFSLIVATLRDPTLRRTYLKVTVLRALAVVVVATLAVATSRRPSAGEHQKTGVYVKIDSDDREALKAAVRGVHLPGVEVNEKDAEAVVEAVRALDADAKPAPPPGPLDFLKRGWRWLAWLIGLISLSEAIVTAVSRRWDDWLGFHASRLARTLPEDSAPKEPKLVFFDGPWLLKKIKRRIRGYAVVFAGLPVFFSFTFLPVLGDVMFAIGATIWSWYWLTVFAASKSAHAWADDGRAPSPLLIREAQARLSTARWASPIRSYVRLWAWVTSGVNSPAMTVERAPAPFAGLAVARVILSLPGIYLLARPIIPVAAGRLCAETDPLNRFSVPEKAEAEPEESDVLRRAA
jgi:hypothetical protein